MSGSVADVGFWLFTVATVLAVVVAVVPGEGRAWG